MKPDDYSGLDVSIRELEQEWGISRNALKQRAKKLGVQLKPISSTLTVWPGEYVELGHQLHEHLSTGEPMGTFPGIAPSEASVPSALAPTAAITASNEIALTALAAAITDAVTETKTADPLVPARLLKKAAELDVPLTQKELSAVLGRKELRPQNDGDEVRPGYFIHRQLHKGKTFWTVSCPADGTASIAPLHLASAA